MGTPLPASDTCGMVARWQLGANSRRRCRCYRTFGRGLEEVDVERRSAEQVRGHDGSHESRHRAPCSPPYLHRGRALSCWRAHDSILR